MAIAATRSNRSCRHGLERFAQVEIPDLHALRRQIVPELVEGPFVVAVVLRERDLGAETNQGEWERAHEPADVEDPERPLHSLAAVAFERRQGGGVSNLGSLEVGRGVESSRLPAGVVAADHVESLRREERDDVRCSFAGRRG